MTEFPELRLRRLRRSETLRRMVRETTLSVDDLVYPMFVVDGHGLRQDIQSMPGISRLSPDLLPAETEALARLGVPAVVIFGLPQRKDEEGSDAYSAEGIAQRAVRAIKQAVPSMTVITDVCLCEYTSHGHCGVLVDDQVDNDRTLDLLSQTALTQAEAGADMVAPSAMMDGQVAAIRQVLDEAGLDHIPIMAYAAKFASAFYGPFREAADSTPAFGDRRAYQMDPPNAREALREIEQDILEGADIIMVKPALAYLDIVARARASFDLPLAAYNVSAEYSLIKAAAQRGWIDEQRITLEVLTAIKRAGADLIISYHAREVAAWLKEGHG
ncbi:MAG: porphobilinogen synthase [Chloroflexi bacterium]|nr:porphobilinogen synthase [Chloroflexota bacterium]